MAAKESNKATCQDQLKSVERAAQSFALDSPLDEKTQPGVRVCGWKEDWNRARQGPSLEYVAVCGWFKVFRQVWVQIPPLHTLKLMGCFGGHRPTLGHLAFPAQPLGG